MRQVKSSFGGAKRVAWLRGSALLALCLLVPAAFGETEPAASVPQPVAPGCPALAPEAVLATLNAVRAMPRQCGPRAFAAAAALRWSAQLAESAGRHVQQLAARNTLSHRGQQAESLRQRLRESGYRLRLGGENLAAGPADADEALAQWLLSPEHCANLMAPAYEEAALACAANNGEYGRFWVLHLGAALPALP
ncbi:CAP domain-containing protein [Paucibacter sp. APW11]|uniref:CAP domain-containing protein n=1 Tax=Roseateles aquae TaxID=3077235 RepID=A0ABU3PG37_9BURK|nr:CAP domain-containing protein [Paucibacter sp. APW11]MDT9000901.1 CAP domain-containing protein [Paucibacter sp. APW11]